LYLGKIVSGKLQILGGLGLPPIYLSLNPDKTYKIFLSVLLENRLFLKCSLLAQLSLAAYPAIFLIRHLQQVPVSAMIL